MLLTTRVVPTWKTGLYAGLLAGLLSYQPVAQPLLQAEGPIPADFLRRSSETYAERLEERQTDQEKRFVRKTSENFYLASSFQIRNWLYSGQITFNDPVSQYTGRVLDEVLRSQPALRKQVRIYTVLTPRVNAFTTDDGMIFVTLGLLSQLENEAQLAFILSHEVVHYTKKHVIRDYLESNKARQKRGDYRQLSEEDRKSARWGFSKEQEMEADLEGLNLFLKTGYTAHDLTRVFDVMAYAHIPYDDRRFPKSYFEDEFVQFPDSLFLEEVAAIHPENEDDDHSSHPAIPKRRAAVEAVLARQSATAAAGSQARVSEEGFLNMRHRARHDIAQLYLQRRQYEPALYQAFLLEGDGEDPAWTKQVMLQCLYGLTSYANRDKFNEVHVDEEEIEGQSQQVYHFFAQLEPKALNILAVKYAWDLTAQFPDDTYARQVADSLVKELVYFHKVALDEFQAPRPAPSADAQVDEAQATSNKYDKIRQRQTTPQEDLGFESTALAAWRDNARFVTLFEQHQAAHEKEESLKKKKNYHRTNKKSRTEAASRHAGLTGIDRMLVVDPEYIKISEIHSKGVQFLASEQANDRLNFLIQDNAQRLGLDTEILDDLAFGANDVDKFNDYVRLNRWIGLRMSHFRNGIQLATPDDAWRQAMMKKYDTRYFCRIGFASVRERRERIGQTLVLSAITFYGFPFGLYYAFTPDCGLYHYQIVMDLETGTPVFHCLDYINNRDRPDLLKSVLYDNFYQLQRLKL
ncbi:Peptidase family M48 [Catalinimonas alkaloidigena]|uniref:Peptidase family M48 n=1 Tax=Catalinimonas alkaloidigena TaxID=1075417 RepID=A0A1G9ASG9_9BACT|nr:M48 family metallopeptidase [Catalinimonas alkaloidigena]SDK29774.1 Peptidase family M48 [Catalinimonas alkaloidigena]